MENQKQHQYRQQPDHTARKPHGDRKTVIVEVVHDINTERKRRVIGHINQRRVEIIPKRDKLQQHDGKEYIANHRDHNPEQHREIPATIDICRLRVIFGRIFKCRMEHQKICAQKMCFEQKHTPKSII